jgi:hypothetical protein
MYSGLIKTMYFVAAFVVLIPVGPIITLFGMILFYFALKYHLIRHCSGV